jgi:hypothetical protein
MKQRLYLYQRRKLRKYTFFAKARNISREEAVKALIQQGTKMSPEV